MLVSFWFIGCSVAMHCSNLASCLLHRSTKHSVHLPILFRSFVANECECYFFCIHKSSKRNSAFIRSLSHSFSESCYRADGRTDGWMGKRTRARAHATITTHTVIATDSQFEEVWKRCYNKVKPSAISQPCHSLMVFVN